MDNFYIGVDIGGSFTRGGLVKNGEVIYKTRVPTTQKSLESAFAVINEIINTNKVKLSGIGICIAGMVMKERILLSAINLGLEESMNIAGIMEEKYGIPTKIGNDLSCFALAEAKYTQCDNLVYLAPGTGLNIGVINRGKVFSGANGVSIEYGHTCFWPVQDKSTPVCACGLPGCVEMFVSGKALMALGKKAGIKATRPEEVFNASQEIADGFISCLKIIILNLANTFRPEKIVIGGGLAPMIKPYLDILNNDLKAKNYGYKNAPPIIIETSKLDSAVLGAAGLFNDDTDVDKQEKPD
jgi:glucokinase